MRRILLVLILSLGTFHSLPAAHAALTGCPNTWEVPTRNQALSNGLPIDLATYKKDRAFDVVITPLGTEYSTDGTNWVKAGNENSGSWDPLMFAFAGKQGRDGWKIEVRGCPDSINRYYGYDLVKQRDPLEVKDVNTFFNDAGNREKFGGPSNFQEYSKFTESFEKCKNELVLNAKTYFSSNGSKDLWRDGFPSTLPSCQFVQSKSNNLQLFFKDSSCSSFDNGTFRVANGAKCSAFLGYFYYPAFSLSIVNFISLSEIQLEGPQDQTPSLQKAATDRAALLERIKPTSPYIVLTQNYSDLARVITESLLPKVNSIKDLRTKANQLRSAIIDTRDQILKVIYQPVPDLQVVGMLPQWQKQLDSFQQQVKDLERMPNQAVSLICVKGGVTKVISGKNPKCPAGYKVKK